MSEIIGIGFAAGKRPASRLDSVIRTTKDLPVTRNDDGSWKLAAEGAKGTLKLSEVGLGNVTPSLKNPKTNNDNHGGVTVRSARQITVLSLPALRRLRFPVDEAVMPDTEKNGDQAAKGKAQHERDLAAQTVLAVLGLAAVAWQWKVGFSLRSRCDLFSEREWLAIEQVGGGKKDPFTLTYESAKKLLDDATKDLRSKTGLSWNSAPIRLMPTDELAKVVKRSRELAAEGN